MKNFKSFFIKFKNIYLDLFIFFIITCLYLFIVLLNINILSLKYIIPIAIFLLLLIILNFFVIRKGKKKVKIVFSVISTLLGIIFIILSIILLNLFSSVQNMFSTDSYVEYSVMVTKESEYNKIDDLDKKLIGYYQSDKYHEEAQKKLSTKIDAEYIGYSTIEDLKDSLIDGQIDSIMILDSYLDIIDNNDELDETNIVDSFKEKTKTIYKFKIKVDNSKNTKDIDLEKGAFAIYVSGQDSYASSVSEASRSDVNMLVVVNLNTKQILLLSIPRDYYITIDGIGAYDKLTHISIYGSEVAANSIGNILNVNVDYFVKFNFTTFMKAIEYLLPLDVYSDYSFTTGVYDQTIGTSYTFSKGYNHITSGEMALQFVRARKNFSEGDRQRGINQTRMLKAVINKVATPQVLIKYNDILKALNGTFLTNISNDSIVNIIKYILNNNGKFNIYNYALDGSDASRTTYSGGSMPLYVMIPNTESINYAEGYIKDILNGEIPNIEIDDADLADSSHSSTVIETPYKPPYYPPNNSNSNNNSNDNNTIVEENTNEETNDKPIEVAPDGDGELGSDGEKPTDGETSEDDQINDDSLEDNENIEQDELPEEDLTIDDNKNNEENDNSLDETKKSS